MDDSEPRNDETGLRSSLQHVMENTAFVVRFYSRLPFPTMPWETSPFEMPSFKKIVLFLPLASFIIALPGVLLLILTSVIGLTPWLCATIAVGMTTLMTGAFHEDGLADVADGFGGGYTIERRLVIMGDSRLGTFGVCALILCFILKIGAFAVIVGQASLWAACTAFILTAIVARISSLAVIVFIPPVRLPEATYTAETFSPKLFTCSILIIIGLTFILGIAFFSLKGLILVPLLTLLASYGLGKLSMRLISGQTGDVAGAAEQISEILCLLILSVSLS